MTDYVLKPVLTEASLGNYVALFDAAFGGDNKLTTAYLDWQYRQNPHGPVIGVDAFFGTELAAHYAIIPRRYGLDGEVYQAALSVNTATHPRHQGKGLFTKLAAATYEAAAARGVQFVIGAANANSVGGFTRKLQFLSLGQIRLYAGFAAPKSDPYALDLDIDADWMDWRFHNPSRYYSRTVHGDGSATVSTRLKGMPFHLRGIGAQCHDQAAAVTFLPKAPIALPGLIPFFGTPGPLLPRLPLKAQPSPWYVIWRALDSTAGAHLIEHVRFDGLSMDTF